MPGSALSDDRSQLPQFRGDEVALLADRVSGLLRGVTLAESVLCRQVAGALGDILAQPDWIPGELRRPGLCSYRRELLHEAPDGSFSIGCFVWGPGQQTPIHDHRCWCVTGAAIGGIRSVRYEVLRDGRLAPDAAEELAPGECEWIRPEGTDIHCVSGAGCGAAVSIHVYGAAFSRVCRRRYTDAGAIAWQ